MLETLIQRIQANLDSPGPVFLSFEVLALHDALFLNNLKFIFSLFDNTMPLSLRYLYNTRSNITSEWTCRFHYLLILPAVKTTSY